MSSAIPDVTLESDSKLLKRTTGIVVTGGIPASIVSFCGDLFTPKGGWIVVAIIGVLALIIGFYLIVSLNHRDESSPLPWWYRLTSTDKELSWIWKARTPFLAHGVHVVLFFSIVCLFVSQKSFAAVQQGGILAKSVDAIAVAQRQLGISEQILSEQKKTTAAIESLSSKADNFKREISDDPRIQLADKGVMWESSRLTQAIKANDKPTVQLFLKGGMPIAVVDALAGFKSADEETKKMLMANRQLFNPNDCTSFLGHLEAPDVLEADKFSGEMTRAFCTNDKAQAYVEQELDTDKKYLEKQLAAYNDALSNIKSPEDCMKYEWRENGRPLMQEVSQFNIWTVTTMNKRQEMLARINIDLVTGRHNQNDAHTKVRKYCESQATEKPNIDTDDRFVKRWKLIRRWIN